MDVIATQIRATLGFDDAQFALGLLYYDGTGVPRDREKAMRLFKRAADQGNANAAWSLAQAERAAQVERAAQEERAAQAARAYIFTRVPASCAPKAPRAPKAPQAPKAPKSATGPTAPSVPKPKAQSAARTMRSNRTENANGGPSGASGPTRPSRSGRGRGSGTDSVSVSMDWEPTSSYAVPTQAPPITRRRLLNTERHALSLRFGHRCADAKCRVLLPVGWHADHIVPLADGGPDDTANMQPLCPPCHMLKTARENSGRKTAH